MNISFHPQAGQISPMRAARFAPADGREAKPAQPSRDTVEISSEAVRPPEPPPWTRTGSGWRPV